MGERKPPAMPSIDSGSGKSRIYFADNFSAAAHNVSMPNLGEIELEPILAHFLEAVLIPHPSPTLAATA
jgi:hypothetical protein